MSRASPPQSTALNPLGSDFDRFLYAQVGDDRHGGLLSVISALARLGVDPWEQAATLARMPLDRAARALSVLLARLPPGTGAPLDPVPVATRLVALLPRILNKDLRDEVIVKDGAGNLARPLRRSRLLMTMLCVACVLLFLGVQHLLEPAPQAPSTPVANPVPQADAVAPGKSTSGQVR